MSTCLIAVGLIAASAAFCEDGSVRAIAPYQNPITAELGADPTPRQALVGTTDRVFPHIATGGGWETVMVIVNMSTTTVRFTQQFFKQDGSPMTVTFRSVPAGVITTATSTAGTLSPGGSFNFSLFDSTPVTQTGWASRDYDSTNARLGAYALFRQISAGRPDFEALVPLSAYDDSRFMMPFDNI